MITVHLHTILQIETPSGRQRRLEVDLPPGGTIRDLLELLDVKLSPDAMIFLVNGRPQREGYELAEGDEVNLIPRVVRRPIVDGCGGTVSTRKEANPYWWGWSYEAS